MSPSTPTTPGARPPRIPRRRALSLIGAAAGLACLPGDKGAAARDRVPLFEWRGQALGAEARLLLAHPRQSAARRAAAACVAEIARLERIFSLFQAGSEIARLNRDGRLPAASLDMRLLLAEARRLGALTGGHFDVTVQPLWRLYRRHFAQGGPASPGPSERRVAAARGLVDYRAIELDGGGVRFARAGMAATLNGIAQGYITDRAADLLRDSGFDDVLVQLGETRALGRPQPGRPWRVAVPDPRPGKGLLERFELGDRAIATSSGLAGRFDAGGGHHHLFDPLTGRSATSWSSVSVIGARATVADALSTALAVAPPPAARQILAAAGDVQALLLPPTGDPRRINSGPVIRGHSWSAPLG